jgi:signal transduction histidine kinase
MATTGPAYASGIRAVGRSGRLAALSDQLTGRSARHFVGILAIAAACGSLALTGSVEGLDGFDIQTLLEFAVGCSFVASGLVAWSKRENRLGPLMTLIGLTWFARPLVDVDSSPVFTGAIWLQDTWFLLFALFLLSLPYGRLTSRFDFLTMGLLIMVALPLELAWLFFFDAGSPGNALVIWPNAAVADAIDWGQRGLVFLGSFLLAVSLWTRWLEATAPLRRILIPALVGGAAVLVSTVTTVLSKLVVPPQSERWVELCAFIAVPMAVLAGMLRARLARSSVGDVFVALQANPPPEALREALADALDDASLELAFWLPDYGTYVDLDGRSLELPLVISKRAATPVERSGKPVAVLVHDASLLEEPELLEAVGAAAGIALENARLHAELHARLEELRGSRARIVEAGQSERQRLERDLHDGAQQRLIALSLELKLLGHELSGNSDVTRRLDEAQKEITQSLEELRAVAHGIHPAVLTGHGLAVALEQVAARASIPVRLAVDADGRFPEQVEVAAYYVVAESLTNVDKHACARRASIQIEQVSEDLVVEVVDDGVGGADSERGSGLRGLADRVEALGGRLRVWTPRGGGTRVRAEIPCV